MNETELKTVILSELGKVALGANLNTLELDDDLREALDIDSFDHLNFLIGLHDKLGVDIPEKDYGRLNTMNQIIQYLLACKV